MDNLNVLKPTDGEYPVPILYIGDAIDITNGTHLVEDDSIFRITAITDARIWYYKTQKEGVGLLLNNGSIIDIPARRDWTIEVVGEINLCKYII